MGKHVVLTTLTNPASNLREEDASFTVKIEYVLLGVKGDD